MIGIDTLGLGVSKNHGIIDKYLGDHKMYAIENLCNLKNIPNKNLMDILLTYENRRIRWVSS